MKKYYRKFIDQSAAFQRLRQALATSVHRQDVLVRIGINSIFINVLGLAFPLVMLQFYDRVIPNHSQATLMLLAMLVAAALVVEFVLKIIRYHAIYWQVARFEHLQGCDLYNRLISLGSKRSKLDSNKTMQKILHYLKSKEFYGGQSLVILADLPFVLVYLACIYWIGGSLVIIPIIVGCLFMIITERASAELQEALDARKTRQASFDSFITEVLLGIKTIKCFAMEHFMQRRYERLQRHAAKQEYLLGCQSTQGQQIGQLATQITLIAVVSVGSLQIIHEHMTIGSLAACSMLANRVLGPVTQTLLIWRHLQSALSADRDLQGLGGNASSLPLADSSTSPSSGSLPDPINGEVILENVTFGFSQDTPLFENLSLHIPANQCISLQGDGGSGKSVLLKLIAGVYLPHQGSCCIDGLATQENGIRVLSNEVAYISQDAPLYQGSLLENLTLFDPSRTHEALNLAESTGLSKIIYQLPDGYDSVIDHDYQHKFSYGLRQQLLLIRKLIGKPKIVLFDNVNSAVDREVDEFFVKVLQGLKGHCTLILVSHRPLIIRLADNHYQIINGKIGKIYANDHSYLR